MRPKRANIALATRLNIQFQVWEAGQSGHEGPVGPMIVVMVLVETVSCRRRRRRRDSGKAREVAATASEHVTAGVKAVGIVVVAAVVAAALLVAVAATVLRPGRGGQKPAVVGRADQRQKSMPLIKIKRDFQMGVGK